MVRFVPGICVDKFLYVGLDLQLEDQQPAWSLGCMNWLPNPRLPFIWLRVALPGRHPELLIEEAGAAA